MIKLILLVAIGSLIQFTTQESQDSLKLLHVFFRHGSRTPELKDVYPTDPHKLDSFYPVGWGQLTNAGKLRAYKLGQVLRERYNSFLGDVYVPEILSVNSTDFDRTKLSALLVLSALFKPNSLQTWNKDLPWLPIPYDYYKDEIDYTLRRPNKYCPTYFKELQEVLTSDEAQLILKSHQSTLDYITNHTGKETKTFGDIFSIYQTLKAEETLNLPLPEWTNTVWPTEITNLAVKQCEFENYNDILKRLNGGRMLGKAIENMLAKTTNQLQPAERKIFLYSGHENNVINILAALNLYKPHFPLYSAAVIIELHYLADRKEYAVKVYYVRDVDAEPEEMKLENCDVVCPWNKFVEITRPHVPVNYTAECHSNINLDLSY